jgi:MerR family transcriptional regulator, redox-sensitive transcriptional activator SoxR
VALIELAKRSGFTLAEISVLLAGLSQDTLPPRVWERLAQRKLPEIERKLAETEAMKRVLQAGLRCRCASLRDCLALVVLTPARVSPERAAVGLTSPPIV